MLAALPEIGRTSAWRRLGQRQQLVARHRLDLVDVLRALVVAQDLVAAVGVALGVAGHEVGVLDLAHGRALGVLAGDQVDRLVAAPLLLRVDDGADVGDVDGHGVSPVGNCSNSSASEADRATYTPGVKLETERLILREFVLDDAVALAACRQGERFWRYYEVEDDVAGGTPASTCRCS